MIVGDFVCWSSGSEIYAEKVDILHLSSSPLSFRLSQALKVQQEKKKKLRLDVEI